MKSFRSYFLFLFVIGGVIACRVEIYPISPPQWPIVPTTPSGCQPPSIERNIVGSWHFESNYTTDYSVKTGQVTFDAKGNINDPDLLFPSPFDTGNVQSKTYKAAVNSPFPDQPGNLFVVYQTTKGSSNAVYFAVVSNECSRIHVSLLSTQNQIGFILTR